MNEICKLIETVIKSEKDILLKFQEVYEKKQGAIFTYFNQNSFNQFFGNDELIRMLDKFVIYQEGIGMYLLLKLFNKKNFDRIDSTKVLEEFTKFLIDRGETVVFIGGNFEPSNFVKRCNVKSLNVEFYSNGFFDLKSIETIAQKLKDCKSRYFLLGMGTPKQEIVAYNLMKLFPDKIFICIGNFINFFLGYQRRAPKFFRLLQLEWFFRLMLEPKRLFVRYVIGIPLFFIRALIIRLKCI